MERAPGPSPEDCVLTSSWPLVACSTAGSPEHRFVPRGTSPWPKASPRRGHPPHLSSLCPTSTSSYTMSSWETAAVNQNAAEKIIRRYHSESDTQSNILQRKIRATAGCSTKGAKAMWQEDPQDSKNQPKLQHRAGWLGLLVVFMGSFLDGFGHPAPGMEQEQQ